MTQAELFRHQFDEDGRYEKRNGSVRVVFIKGDKCLDGELHFTDGFCTRITMDGASPWENVDGTPLNQLHYLLHFDGKPGPGILVDRGRIVAHYTEGVRKDG